MSIEANYQEITREIAALTDRNVKIVGVSKFQEEHKMKEAWAIGLHSFGENRVQEGKRKQDWLPKDAEWHLIGHLQKNKVRQAVQYFNWIQSVDSLELAELLNYEAYKLEKRPKILIQVNVAKEPQKFGVSEKELSSLAERVAGLAYLDLAGMMVMAPLFLEVELTRPIFYQGRMLFESLKEEIGDSIQFLSMGMSNDYPIAVDEGANLVRIGRILFEDVK